MILLICLVATAPDTLWSNVTSGGVYSSVAPYYLWDGGVNVVCGLNFWDDEPTLWCMSGATGDTLWTSDQYNGIYQDEGLLAVPDMNGGGKGDILMVTPGGYAPPGRCVYLIEGSDGSTIWQWSAYLSVPGGTGWGYCCDIVPLDQTGDYFPEFLAGFGTTGSSGTGLAVCIDGQLGDTIWTASTIDAVEDIMSVPDVTGDTILEVVLGIGGNSYTSNTLVLLNGSYGAVLWERSAGGDVMCLASVDRAETDPWVAACTFNGQVQCYDLGGDSVWAVNPGGMLLDIEAGPDLNGDGISELALAGDNSGTICLDGATGATLWTYPTGSNTWSVAWVDPVWSGGEPVPCIAGGSVNGRRVTLVNALTGGLIWEQPFTERVYNVSIVDMPQVSASPIVIAGLQDQESQPFHAWALLSSTETSCESGLPEASPTNLVGANPSRGFLLLQPPSGDWNCRVYDLAGRVVWSGELSGPASVDLSGWAQGCYSVRMYREGSHQSEMVTVLQ